jgi:hypothetical protein
VLLVDASPSGKGFQLSLQTLRMCIYECVCERERERARAWVYTVACVCVSMCQCVCVYV